MILGLNNQEFKLAKSLTTVALGNATESFAKMTGDKFTFKGIEINKSSFSLDKGFKNTGEPLYLMITEYLGDVLADTFLIMTPENAKKFAEKLYPAPGMDETLHDAILLEIDNITAAGIATKYADLLDQSITGGVPQMVRKNATETQQYINNKLVDDHTHFSFITHFKSKRDKLEACFVCAFKDSFGDAVKSIASEQKAVELIGKQEQQAKQYVQ